MGHKIGGFKQFVKFNQDRFCLIGLHQLFSFSFLHNRSRAPMRLRQSHTLKREQCRLEPIYECPGPHTPVPDCLPIVGGGDEVLPKSLQCNQVVAFSTPIAETGDIRHDCGKESVHLSLLKRQKQQVRAVPYMEWEVMGRHRFGSPIQLRDMKATFMGRYLYH